MVSQAQPKPKVAIFDFTDCEGCEVALISLREKLLELAGEIEIVNWRLAQKRADEGPYDVVIIEGTPVTQHEIDMLRFLREQTKVLIGLGSCATLGGIPGIIDKSGSWYSYDGERIGQGRENVKKFLNENPDIYNSALIKVKEALGLSTKIESKERDRGQKSEVGKQ